MLIYAKHYGQMCNRLWALLPSLAYAMERKISLYVLFARKDYVDCFPMLKSCPFLTFLFTSRTTPHWAWRVNRFVEKYNLEVTGELQDLSRLSFLSFVDGWAHSNDESFISEQKGNLIQLFQPSLAIRKKVDKTFSSFEGLTVGVHIRRGDYKEYLGGKYYFSDDVYGRYILNIKKQLDGLGKRCRFLICSNESFDWHHEDVDLLRIPDADGITDLYGLSSCDFIMGPPSSYSQWASFVGDVPIAFMLQDKNHLLLEHFSPVTSFNVLENGKRLKFDNNNQRYELK
jgi:hypothetical protein